MRNLEKFRRVSDIQRAFARQRAFDDIGYAPGLGDMTTILVDR